MKRLAGKTALILFAFLAGMGITAVGLSKPDAFAAGLSVKSLAFGDAESSSEVYIVTDWFCPACRAAEPEILKGARKAMQQAKVNAGQGASMLQVADGAMAHRSRTEKGARLFVVD